MLGTMSQDTNDQEDLARAPARCPHCGEVWDGAADISGGEHQTYEEDCAVCCRPCSVTATFDSDRGEFDLVVTSEG